MAGLAVTGRAGCEFFESAKPAYKVSRFNARAIAPDGSLVAYNTRSGKICIFPQKVAAAVERCLTESGVQEGQSSLRQYLAKRGYLVPAQMDELLDWDLDFLRSHYRTDTLDLVLLTTEDCNFRCVYCYGKFPPGIMPRSVRMGLRKAIESRLPQLTQLSIGWYGGEPLLGWEVIEELAPFFLERATAAGVGYNSRITTNGYLLTSDVARRLLDWRVLSYQITLDGLPETHNKSRPLHDGGPTFERILDNLTAIAEFADPFSVRLRVNFDQENVASLEQFMELIRERLRGDPRFQIAFHAVGQWGGPNDAALAVIAKSQVAGHQRVLRRQARSACVPYESATKLTALGGICYAARPTSFHIGADGRVMKCANKAPASLDVVGRVTEENGLELDQAKHHLWEYPYYLRDDECRECFYLPACLGGIRCPLARVEGRRPPCPPERAKMQALLLEYWEEKRAQGVLPTTEGTAST